MNTNTYTMTKQIKFQVTHVRGKEYHHTDEAFHDMAATILELASAGEEAGQIVQYTWEDSTQTEWDLAEGIMREYELVSQYHYTATTVSYGDVERW